MAFVCWLGFVLSRRERYWELGLRDCLFTYSSIPLFFSSSVDGGKGLCFHCNKLKMKLELELGVQQIVE